MQWQWVLCMLGTPQWVFGGALCRLEAQRESLWFISVQNTWHEENPHIRVSGFHKGQFKGHW